LDRLKPGQDGTHVTFCRICEAFCGLTVDVAEGRMTKIKPHRENPHSRGHVCIKGTAFLDLVYDPDRITQPMRRVGPPGVFEPVTWDEAMEDIATRLGAIIREDGPDAVANYIGNPTAFSNGAQLSIRPFLAHFGIWKMFSAATQDVTSWMLASYLLYGSAFRFAIPDLPRCDFLLIFGANPLVSHGSTLTAPRIRDDLNDIAERGRVVVVDPRRTETAARYEHVPIVPDTDAWMLAPWRCAASTSDRARRLRPPVRAREAQERPSDGSQRETSCAVRGLTAIE
jgi:anaerobic selenocysteine-containing dehydrogenase